MYVSRLALVAAVALGLSACADDRTGTNRFAYVEEPVEQLYRNGTESLETRRYEDAIAYFAEVERQHPYSAWARRAMLMTAYTEYLTNDFDASLESIDRFLAIHPGNKDAGYAYYLRAMNHYERIRDVKRDQGITRDARDALIDVIRRYPGTEYARDAQLKLDLTLDHLAGKEMDIGRWYLERNQHVAALGRFSNVLDKYQTTSHTEEALHRSVEAYLELGLVEEARRHAAWLGHNYPNSEWYEDTYRVFRRHGQELLDLQAANAGNEEEREELTPEQKLERAGRIRDLDNAPEVLSPQDEVDVTPPTIPGQPPTN
ncbi:outer membrane protein assembly factor BamD [Parvularcula sp. ZS-1/3]|uniref:Outer membrane protein assembly factor BamD n=1 Tax=Parvularcula mediterranea TaxID=2732508 RepID=A0A7Y3W5F7_9PROT|nr:outer membrane protein assembly factor BamD [Parvularcula mediterranea]NNU16252.1 outer membrane protein assembly factor BamD [Parvularcula mediterranea]